MRGGRRSAPSQSWFPHLSGLGVCSRTAEAGTPLLARLRAAAWRAGASSLSLLPGRRSCVAVPGARLLQPGQAWQLRQGAGPGCPSSLICGPPGCTVLRAGWAESAHSSLSVAGLWGGRAGSRGKAKDHSAFTERWGPRTGAGRETQPPVNPFSASPPASAIRQHFPPGRTQTRLHRPPPPPSPAFPLVPGAAALLSRL